MPIETKHFILPEHVEIQQAADMDEMVNSTNWYRTHTHTHTNTTQYNPNDAFPCFHSSGRTSKRKSQTLHLHLPVIQPYSPFSFRGKTLFCKLMSGGSEDVGEQ